MKKELMNNVTRTFGRLGLKVKKHSPEILLVSGLVAGGAALVAACRATTKLETVLNETKSNAEQVHECAAAGEICVQEGDEIRRVEYTEEDSKKDLTIIYAKGTMKVAKLYAPAIGLGAVSLVCILASHGIIHKRNTALAAAVTAIGTDFDNYRGRVVERFGPELDRELRYNIKAKEVEETVVQEDGTETVVKKTIDVVESPYEGLSEFARCFCEGCTGHSKDPESNLKFLILQERWLNDRLESMGHVFLNEFHDALGLPRTSAGAIMGWVYDPNNPRKISFGIHNAHIPANREFVNGWERSIWLDPNIDKEPIYTKIG
jgi:hypothetical protein